MSQKEDESSELGDELRALGANLRDILQSAWESEERKRLQQEIETGLDELAATLRTAAKDFGDSPTGQRLHADARDLQERLRTGRVEPRVREELLAALRKVNAELSKAAKGKGPGGPPAEGGTPAPSA